MNAVGKLGSYISRSVTTVSGPFHPFGGAVDIIVVEQQDGSFKSSPWYVRFGKFQGVLKSKEKVVSINVNGVDVDFNMYLDHRGEAYFLREVEAEEGDSLFSPSSSGEDTDGQLQNRGPLKSKSWSCSADFPDSVTQIDVSNGNVVARTNSKRSRILGFVFGRKSIKGKKFSERENGTGVVRAESLERAEIAADLLEVNWSTSFASSGPTKDNPSRSSAQDVSKDDTNKDLKKNDGQSNEDSGVNRNIEDNLDGCKTCEEPSSAGAGKNHNSPSSLQKLENTVEETAMGISCSVSDYLVETVALNGSTNGGILDKPVKTKKSGLVSEDNFENAVNIISEIEDPNLQASDSLALEPCPDSILEKEQVLDEKLLCLSDASLNKEEDGAGRNQSLICHEISHSQMIASDDSFKQTNRISCLSCGMFGEACVHSEMLHLTTDSAPEVMSQPENETSRGSFKVQEFLIEKNHIFIEGNRGLESEITSSNSDRDNSVTKSSPQVVTSQSSFHERVESRCVSTMSTGCNLISEVQENISFRKEVGDTQKPGGDSALLNILGSEISEEEQLLFGDLDEFTINELKNLEFISQKEEEADLWLSSRESEGANEPPLPKYETSSSRDSSPLEDTQSYADDGRRKLKTTSHDIHIPIDNKVQPKEITRMVRSLPDMRSLDNRIANDLGYPLDRSLEGADDDGQSILAQQTTQDSRIIDEMEVTQTNPPGDNPSKPIDASSGSWKIWPFPSKRPGSIVSDPSPNCNGSPDAENVMKSPSGKDEPKDVPKINIVKKKIITLTPTSEQLATLNLKEGRNIVTFTFSTPMLGKQQVDACIYLWRWDTRIVISDVDGTITRSDVLGQFMPLVGVDWSQTGVAHLFSAIKENGYQLIFLSARAISQAYHTRQFLFNLKQDGKTLPDGPVVISPDGLFPSLFREVVRRAPHEFKIACLEEIKALFPSDMNPFYAGFGNRDTDEFSYLKVGIPKGKIFIINPKGEIVVNRHIDTKSYTSIHALVNGMFPPTSLSDEQEDYNTWNFWKLPPPAINI